MSKIKDVKRSPIVLEDLELLTQLPRGRVHYTVTPIPKEEMARLETIAISPKRPGHRLRGGKMRRGEAEVYYDVATGDWIWESQGEARHVGRIAGQDLYCPGPPSHLSPSWLGLCARLRAIVRARAPRGAATSITVYEL